MIQLLSDNPSRWSRLGQRWQPTLRYCLETEAHVYALAVSASVLLSFYPFLIVMLSFCRNVLHWPAAVEAIYVAIQDYFPGDLADFIKRNSPRTTSVQITSMLLLMFTANGIFMPLEVALNRLWGATANRSYVKNQLVASGLIFLCGGLALLSLILTALNQPWISEWAGRHQQMEIWLNILFFKLAALPISILALFFMFWLLPNRKIAPMKVVPVAIFVGLALEGLKYVNLLVWPFIREKLRNEYGVFVNSASILLWSFVGAMIVLTGARWAARHDEEPLQGCALPPNSSAADGLQERSGRIDTDPMIHKP